MQRLDLESRALLELSFVHRLGDEELASMLATEPARVRERREKVLGELGASSEDERQALAAALAAALAERALPEPSGPAPAAARRRALPALAGALLIALALAGALLLGGDDDAAEPSLDPADERPKREAEPRAEPQPAPRARAEATRRSGPQPKPPAAAEPPVAGGPVKLEPIAGTRGSASARIVGGPPGPRLRLTVRGLPRPSSGGYVVWLYESVSEARALTGSRRGSFTVTEPLPPGGLRYRFLDLSREPADGNRNHSGESVLRLALSKLRRR